MSEIVNARIRKTMIGIEDRGIFTAWVFLEWESSSQGFGGYFLENVCGPAWIRQVLEAVGVYSWEDLPGKYVRIDREPAKILRIGHIIEERWFDPASLPWHLADAEGGRLPKEPEEDEEP